MARPTTSHAASRCLPYPSNLRSTRWRETTVRSGSTPGPSAPQSDRLALASAIDECARQGRAMRRTPEASGDPLRAVSPAIFALIIVVFFLPFVTCNGVKVSGVQAATGFTPPGSDPAAKTISSDAQAPNPLVLIGLGR